MPGSVASGTLCIKSVLWSVAKRLSYIEDARCLKVNEDVCIWDCEIFMIGWLTHDKYLKNGVVS